MKKYIYIGGFGFFGALLRYVIKNIRFNVFSGNFPINTIIINITGCFLIAFFSTLFLSNINIKDELKLAITTGFIGTYTTFSSMCKDIVNLINWGAYSLALLYISGSIALGFAAIIIGIKLAKITTGHVKALNTGDNDLEEEA